MRVFPPIPLDGWPKDLARLQVSGTELDDPEPPAAPGRRCRCCGSNPELEMSAGKEMAQAGHGAQFAWWALSERGSADRLARRGFPSGRPLRGPRPLGCD